MVSFICDHCQDTIKKPKADMHVRRCSPPSLSCVDCYKTFTGLSYKQHTSCITEEQKCHGSLYKPKKGQGNQNQQHGGRAQQQQQAPKPAAPVPAPKAASAPAPAAASSSSDSSSSSSDSSSDEDEAPATKSPAELVKAALAAAGSFKAEPFDKVLSKVAKSVRKANPAMTKREVKSLLKENLLFDLADGKLTVKFA
ncbi:hypothetical protein H9P43_007479 [Blastocladiella emersonii ATCC 22665]|nr:hypothetical protein H9P43_007479 [Blastocladiella emersonii ATCC 22665]